MLKGIGGSAGYGIGKVVIISDGKPEYKQHTVTDTDAELQRFENAMEVFVEKTQKMADAMKEKIAPHNGVKYTATISAGERIKTGNA